MGNGIRIQVENRIYYTLLNYLLFNSHNYFVSYYYHHFIEEKMKAQRSYTAGDKADVQGLPVSRAHPISTLCFSSGHLMSS